MLFIFTTKTASINKSFPGKSRVYGHLTHILDQSNFLIYSNWKTVTERTPVAPSVSGKTREPGWVCVQKQEWTRNQNWLKWCHSCPPLSMVPPSRHCSSTLSPEAEVHCHNRPCSMLLAAAIATTTQNDSASPLPMCH